MTPEHTHFQVQQPDGKLAMIQSSNGSFSITRDGVPVAGCRWSVHQLLAAIQCFRGLSSPKPVVRPEPVESTPCKPRRRAAVVPRAQRGAIETWESEGGHVGHEHPGALSGKYRWRLAKESACARPI